MRELNIRVWLAIREVADKVELGKAKWLAFQEICNSHGLQDDDVKALEKEVENLEQKLADGEL